MVLLASRTVSVPVCRGVGRPVGVLACTRASVVRGHEIEGVSPLFVEEGMCR
jgi:hypothetical protein